MTGPTQHNTARTTAQTDSHETETIRDIDPNVQQRKASNPEKSVWVTASAGTGKTKVLTDRVLRLMLPREDGQPGTAPSRILCLTFTKAGAGEMSLRLTDTLANWAVMPLDHTDEPQSLRFRLRGLLNREPSRSDIAAARRLFTQVSDTPGGLKIMTIHSFCQSVLGRFPLEAGIPPHFTPLEDGDANALLKQARDIVLNRASAGDPLGDAFRLLATVVNEEQFSDLIGNIVKEREQLSNLLEKFGGLDGIHQKICADLNLPPNRSAGDMLKDACHSHAFDEPGLRAACRALADHGTDGDRKNAVTLQNWLDAENRVAGFENFALIYLKQDGDIRAKLAGVNVERCAAGTNAVLQAEAERLFQLKDRLNAAMSAELTRDLLLLGQAVITEYQNLKTERAALDYDDLIFTTCALLEGRGQHLKGGNATAWVLYKLDQGLDHILVDEAQDTNPEQWRIIEAIANEFTAGQGAAENQRTLFVVGDGKQSIYSFQRASRELFESMRNKLGEKVKAAGNDLAEVPLNISFRSAESVLQAVDAVFSGPMQNGVSPVPVIHKSFRNGHAGRVELWPLCETPSTPDRDPWTPPSQVTESIDGAALLAAKIADEIKRWIGQEDLPSRGRKIKPGDIMILLRTRNALFNQIAKALKDRKIPVSGTDRMILNEQIAVQDLLAFAQFALQPLDDLTLACILKSPLIGMHEDQLFELAHYREKNTPLWPALMAGKHEKIKSYLCGVINKAQRLRPFDFLTGLLQNPCPADERSGLRALQKRLGHDSIDPIDELLNAALGFEAAHIPSLQNFVHRQTQAHTEIKREMEEAGNFVRIMTVHGAKGLQAPIVILPDTIRTRRGPGAKADARLIWPDKTGLNIPLWTPRSESGFREYDAAMATIDARGDEEYRRLLYVAMTRAEDRLYLAGCTGKKNSRIESWYDAFRPALENLAEAEMLEDGTLRLENLQIKPPADPGKGKFENLHAEEAQLPEFLLRPAPAENPDKAPFRPSRPEQDEEAALPVHSPRDAGAANRFRRGNLTHKLLEVLPGLATENRAKAAHDFLVRFAPDLSEDTRQSIAGETLAILDNPEFARVFGPGSIAEAPITGRLADGRVLSGRIDRLLVTDNEILIVDYKTNRPPPLERRNVPKIYETQMDAYAEALHRIYPGRTISCALLWTDGPRLMKL